VATTRKANSEAQQDAAQLSTELRQHVLPRLITEGQQRQIPAPQTVAKLATEAAERYTCDPAKYEVILRALGLGWPFAEPLPAETKAKVDAVLAAQIAPDEVFQLEQAQAIDKALGRVAEAAKQDVRDLG
jgi:hypothetical protein